MSADEGSKNLPAGVGCRGAMLLEVVVALAIFVVAALAVLTAVQRAAAAVVLARDQTHAMDLAASAMAKIEAGIARPETLNGPVPAWDERELGEGSAIDAGEGLGPSDFSREPPARVSGWELEVRTRGSSFDGLAAVTIVARRRRGGGSESVSASFSVTQFVRLSSRAADGPIGGSR